jgi:hypothetical protein
LTAQFKGSAGSMTDDLRGNFRLSDRDRKLKSKWLLF